MTMGEKVQIRRDHKEEKEQKVSPKQFILDRFGGLISIIVGILVIFESIRLYPLRTSTMVGDHALPGLLGLLLIMLGICFSFLWRPKTMKVEYPSRNDRVVMMLSLILMLAYCFMIPFLGYVISTFLVSIGLFRIYAHFKWYITVMTSMISTTALYLIFILWLKMPFPTGIFTI
jgi:putative tricarboxylic transport membrane protein